MHARLALFVVCLFTGPAVAQAEPPPSEDSAAPDELGGGEAPSAPDEAAAPPADPADGAAEGDPGGPPPPVDDLPAADDGVDDARPGGKDDAGGRRGKKKRRRPRSEDPDDRYDGEDRDDDDRSRDDGRDRGGPGDGEEDFAAVGSGWPPPGVWAAQVGLGCLIMGPLDLVTSFAFAIPIIGWAVKVVVFWAVMATMQASVGDALGNTRGVILWPMLAGMTVELACSAVAGVVGLVVMVVAMALSFALLFGLASSSSGFPPQLIGLVLPVAGVLGGSVLGVGALGARFAALNAAAGAYQFAADVKRDEEWRFPGLIVPNHDDGEAPPRRRGKDRRRRRRPVGEEAAFGVASGAMAF